MASDREITIVIRADGTAAIAGLNSVGDATEKLGSRTASLSATFQKNWAAITAGVAGAIMSLQKFAQYAEATASYAESLETLNALTAKYNTTATEMVAIIQRNANGLIGAAPLPGLPG